MSTHRQTLPTIALSFEPDGATGAPSWFLTVSDGEASSVPVKVTVESATGIAEVVDLALRLPIDLAGVPTSAERVVRLAHVQLLAAQLATAEAELAATDPVRAVVRPVPASAPALAPSGPRRTVSPSRRTQRGAVAQVAAVTPIKGDLAVVAGAGETMADEPPIVDAPPHYSELPEHLPRTSHLEVPPIEEF